MQTWLLWLTCIVTSIQCAVADTQPLTAMQWLQTMENALKSHAFKGTLIYAGANQVDTLQVFHAIFDGIEYEHIVSLDTSAGEVIRDDSKIFCFNQRQHNGRVSVVLPHKRWIGLSSALRNSDHYYALKLGEQQKVMQRSAQVVTIVPKDQFRYQRKIWIDLASSIPVKTQILDHTGRVLEQLMFVELLTDQPISRAQFQLPVDSKHYQWVSQKAERVPDSQKRWHLIGNPTGFEVVNYLYQYSHTDTRKVTHMILSDGISLVSVYIDLPTNAIEPTEQVYNSIGAINLVTLTNNGYRLTIVGEAPSQTIRILTNSIKIIQ